jgi:hypothetical protein
LINYRAFIITEIVDEKLSRSSGYVLRFRLYNIPYTTALKEAIEEWINFNLARTKSKRRENCDTSSKAFLRVSERGLHS